jgi:cobalt-zinc-cadmium efflux system membrane fusion protein
MKNRINAISAAALSVAVLAGCAPKTESKPESPAAAGNVTVTPAQRERLRVQTMTSSTFHRTIETTGTVAFDGDHATTVLAPISGPASRLLVSLGAQVKAGDPLALVDSPDYATAISVYRKTVVSAKNLRRIADLDKQLFDADAIARRDVEQAQTDAVNGEADRDAALQQLRAIGVPDNAIRDIQEDRPAANIAGVLRAPIAGTVVEKLFTPGQLLQAGTTPCFTIADLSQVWVAADIFESQLSSVAIGDTAEVISGASADVFPGTVENISAILDPNTRSIGVRVVAKNPGEVLKKQMYVRVRIRSSRESTGLLGPVAAILRDDENLPFVYVVQANGSFERRHVTLGSRVDSQYEIAEGLKDGEQIVADGGLFVQFQQNQ